MSENQSLDQQRQTLYSITFHNAETVYHSVYNNHLPVSVVVLQENAGKANIGSTMNRTFEASFSLRIDLGIQ